MRSGSFLDQLLAKEGVRPSLRSSIQSIARPQHTFGIIELEHGNEKWKIASKSDWANDSISSTFHDVIPAAQHDGAGDVDPQVSTSGILYDWQNLQQDITTGAGGLSVNYKSNIVLSQLAPDGTVVERWLYHGAWPTDVERGENNYTASTDSLTLTVTWAVDKIYRIDLAATTAPGANTSLPNFLGLEQDGIR